MHITFSPQRSNTPLVYHIDGDVIAATLDGQSETLDLSGAEDGVWEGAPILQNGEVVGHGPLSELGVLLSARRQGGEVYVMLRCHHGPAREDNHDERFPAPVTVTEPTRFMFPREAGHAEG